MMEEQRAVQFVKVKNNNNFAIKDRFDGVPYTILAGKTETLPADAAEHIFGFVDGVDMEQVFHYTVQRHGWNTYKTKDEDARKYVDNISFTPVAARLVMEATTDQATVSTGQQLEVVASEHLEEVPTRSRRGLKEMFAGAAARAPESE